MSKKPKDQAKFEGNGISFKAKIIGIEDVPEARGDDMCRETMEKLKGLVKASGQHKQRIFINVTLEGLRIIDSASMSNLHTHPVHQISFISRDPNDSRAFGYIFSPGDGTHKFFGIKTANAAENLVMSLRDLFQTVYEMKKKEIEEAKAKATVGTEGEGEGGVNTTYQVPPNGQPVDGQESIYQVPKSNAPVNPEQEEAVSNLLDLEDQVDTILKGIEQIKNLEFDDLTSEEAPRLPPTSATTSPTTPNTPAANDPWGVPSPTSPSAAPAASSLSDLQQLSSPVAPNPFGGIPAFPSTPSPSVGITVPGFGLVQSGARPFIHPGQQPPQAAHMMAAGGGAPFGAAFGQQPGFTVPYAAPLRGPMPGQPLQGTVPVHAAAGMQPGFVRSPTFNPFGMPSPAAGVSVQIIAPGAQGAGVGADPFEAPPENLLQPIRPGGQEQTQQAPPKSPTRETLFGDLLDLKKTSGSDATTKSPKEMFKELAQPPKKTLNEIKGGTSAASKS